MAKAKCAICGKEVGFFSKWAVKDGVVCYDCVKGLDKTIFQNIKLFTVDQIKGALSNEIELEKPIIFKCSNSKIIFDRTNKILKKITAGIISSNDLKFDEIIGYNYIEDEKIFSVGHFAGLTAAGGLLFGGVGAVIGAVLGSNQKRKVKKMEIELYYLINNVQDVFPIRIYDNRFNDPGSTTSSIYKDYLQVARQIMITLDNQLSVIKNEQNKDEENDKENRSPADEIRKYKELFDEGIITAEEFEKKKKELLVL